MKKSAPFSDDVNFSPPRKMLAFKVTYQTWDGKKELWQHNEFSIVAPDRIEAKRIAVLNCRCNNGQPVEYHNLEVEQVPK